jgi:D-alanyl-lipoteichoic acid acyltransferase DltB (MBOAT superfamily)
MLFNSLQFLIFFPVVTVLFFLLPHRWRWLHLLIASCVFYTAFIPVYILVLFATIIIDYIAGIYIEKAQGKQRKKYLIISIISNVGVLAIFKYYNFFIENVNTLLSGFTMVDDPLPYLSIILPIGLSFHTFQAMSYTIEVYRGNQKAEKHFGIYALYVMFYPQLVAGPIERPQNMLHQFHERKYFSYDNLIEGMKLITWGLFKKVVIADRLSLLVNEVYNNPSEYQGLTFVVATIFFAFQIYCDFSGYSSIALGSAKVMGFTLMQNFNMPYLATSVREFWQRWHISLSTWFRDYLYIPLGGSKVGKWRWYYNLFITFLVSGIWHGANWTYIIWGGLHGLYIISEQILVSIPIRLNKIFEWMPMAMIAVLKRFWVFVLVSFAWIFFRANSLHDATVIINSILDFDQYNLKQLSLQLVPESKHTVYTVDILLSWWWIVFLVVTEFMINKYPFQHVARPVRWAVYIAGILILLVLGVYDNNQFIYFQF